MSLGYCPHCKNKQTITKPFIRYLSNGRITEQGKCPKCNTNISRFLKKEEQLYLQQLKQENKHD